MYFTNVAEEKKTCANIPKVAFQENFISIRYLFSQGKNFFWCQGLKFQFRRFKNRVGIVRKNGISSIQGQSSQTVKFHFKFLSV